MLRCSYKNKLLMPQQEMALLRKAQAQRKEQFINRKTIAERFRLKAYKA